MSDPHLDRQRRRETAARLREQRETIAREATDEFLEAHPDWIGRYGELARIRGEEDAAFHTDFMAGSILSGTDASFADYALWAAGMLEARSIAPKYLAENLAQVGRAAKVVLQDEAAAELVERMVAAGVRAIERRQPPSSEAPTTTDGLDADLGLYLQAIRLGQRRAALSVTTEALRRGATVPDVYRRILQPAQHEIGRLWERNEITVAAEHMATAITQYVVAQLYEHLEPPEVTRGNAIVTGVRGELHQLGAHMVADVLEADGWAVRFLGTQLPHRGILQAIHEHEPRLLGISATVLSSLPAVAELIDDVRAQAASDLTIIVGGSAFRTSPSGWEEIGADGYGRDLDEAVEVATRLTASET